MVWDTPLKRLSFGFPMCFRILGHQVQVIMTATIATAFASHATARLREEW